MSHLPVDKCNIEFEDVKFAVASALMKNQDVDINIIIHKASKRFEINDGTKVIVTGLVKIGSSNLVPIKKPKVDCTFLSNADFYKELRIRGYDYSGVFRSIKCARVDGQGGKIKWDSNWVAFLSCLLQLQIFNNDSRETLQTRGLRKLIIKPQEHHSIIDAIQNESNILEIVYSKNLNILRCGGVEIRGIQTITLNCHKPTHVPVLEAYKFIPYISELLFSKLNIVRICIELAVENVPTEKIVTVEIDSNDDKETLSEYFVQALTGLPLITGEHNYLSSRRLDLENINIQDSALSSFSNINFIVKLKALNDTQFLLSASKQLKDGGFIVSREQNICEDLLHKTLPAEYQIIAIFPSEDEFIVLVQLIRIKQVMATKAVKITSENYDWIEELKNEILKGPIIAYAEKDEISGIIGLVNCIRREPNGINLKCVFINDHRAPEFNIKNHFYKCQLEKGLAMNVFQNGQWGHFKHVLLKQENNSTPRLDHCFADCLKKGDLSSLTWLRGSYDVTSPKLNLVLIHYASLNFKDIMLTTGQLTTDDYGSGRLKLNQHCDLGYEFSGLFNNRRVMGLCLSGAFATHIEADRNLLWDCPDDWSLEQAATVPYAYATVYSAFFLKANIEKGKTILIHAGSGGVGLAAIRVAIAYGLKVFTTVSSEEKKKFLLKEFPQLKYENIGDSRNVTFEDLIIDQTDGEGVDYVLNSLSGDKLHASIRCLGTGGKFLEIGKFDMSHNMKIGLEDFLKEISFSSISVDNVIRARSETKVVRII